MRTYDEYLFRKRYSLSTIKKYKVIVHKFHYWLDKENLRATKVRYNDMLAYIGFLKRYNKTGTINRKLASLRQYFNYLLETTKIKENPVTGIILKGEKRSIPHNSFSEEELTELYQSSFQKDTIHDKRDHILLGLIVFQGLTVEELGRLSIEDLNPEKGTIYIKQGKRYNGRTLRLESIQILELYSYLREIRPLFLSIYKVQTDRLFVSKKNNLSYLCQRVYRKLKLNNSSLSGLGQLRECVISNWLTKENLRIVQYMAGHKYVSSTERYKANNIQQLKQVVEEFHPLR